MQEHSEYQTKRKRTANADHPILQATDLTKHYGGIHALRDANLDVREGEIHALMGENGAGKSTMAKIIAGVTHANGGSVSWKGEQVAFNSTAEASDAGIAIVLQELSLIPHLSVAENIFLTDESAFRGGWWLKRAYIRQSTIELFHRFGIHNTIDPDRKVMDLSVAEQQIVEIVRALSKDSQLVLLDEPTATLGQQEVESLFAIIRGLRDQGVSFVLVTHRLEEVFAVTDRITVLRDGANSGYFDTAETTPAELIRAMVGRDLGDMYDVRHRRHPGEIVLDVRDLSRSGFLQNCSLQVRRGEVIAIAGLIGSGRTELVRAIFGADRANNGQVTLNGKAGLVRSPLGAIKEGAGMVPEDRKQQGLLIDQSIAHNISLADLSTHGHFWLRSGREATLVQEMIAKLQIKIGDAWRPASSLSGGNQQKVVLAKWLAIDPDLLILDEPTRGIDVGTKHEIYKLIDSVAAAGKAILIVSSELPEVLALADTVLVMSDGQIKAKLSYEEATEEAILEYAAGRIPEVFDTASRKR